MIKKLKLLKYTLNAITKLQLEIKNNKQKIEELKSIINTLKVLFPEILSELNKIKDLLA